MRAAVRFRRRTMPPGRPSPDLDAAFDAGNGLSDQLFDRDDRFLIERGDDGDRGAGAPGAAGAADAMDVVVGMMRDVEIEDVADRGNVETAGGDVGCDQQRNFALAELIERRGARRLIHVAVQGADAEAVLLQRLVQQRDFALAVAEDDRVLEILGVAQQAAQQSRASRAARGRPGPETGPRRRRSSPAWKLRSCRDCAGRFR